MNRTPAILVGLVALAGCDRTIHDSGPVAPPPPEPAVDVGDGSELVADFRENPATAPLRWMETRVRVTAVVTAVEPGEGEPVVTLAGPIQVRPIPVRPIPAEAARFGRLAGEAIVTVEGTVLPPARGDPVVLVDATLHPTSR